MPAVAGTPMEGGGDAGMPEKLLARLSSMNDLPEGIGDSKYDGWGMTDNLDIIPAGASPLT